MFLEISKGRNISYLMLILKEETKLFEQKRYTTKNLFNRIIYIIEKEEKKHIHKQLIKNF